MTFYEALGLEPRLSIELDDLKKRFYARSREWHPDKFSRASAEEQQKALDMTALLNDAFRTLRDPWTRAEYYFKLAGVELAKELSPGILEEFFEANMTLQEFKTGDDSVRGELEVLREKYTKMRADCEHQILEFGALYDGYDTETRQITKLEEPIGDLLNLRRYINNFLRESEKALNVHVSN